MAKARTRWKALSLEELQVLYLKTVGRPTGSSDRAYLIWKIREAENGYVPIGPDPRKCFKGPTTTITVRFEDEFLSELDAAVKDAGFETRLSYIRELMRVGLLLHRRYELAAKLIKHKRI